MRNLITVNSHVKPGRGKLLLTSVKTHTGAAAAVRRAVCRVAAGEALGLLAKIIWVCAASPRKRTSEALVGVGRSARVFGTLLQRAWRARELALRHIAAFCALVVEGPEACVGRAAKACRASGALVLGVDRAAVDRVAHGGAALLVARKRGWARRRVAAREALRLFAKVGRDGRAVVRHRAGGALEAILCGARCSGALLTRACTACELARRHIAAGITVVLEWPVGCVCRAAVCVLALDALVLRRDRAPVGRMAEGSGAFSGAREPWLALVHIAARKAHLGIVPGVRVGGAATFPEASVAVVRRGGAACRLGAGRGIAGRADDVSRHCSDEHRRDKKN